MANVTLQTNPYSLFDSSQWSNPYSNYNNQALPWGNSYAGVPYDSSGNPIQPTPGMTLNQSPAQPQAPAAAQAQSPAAALYQMMSQPSVLNPSGNAAVGMANWGGFLPAGSYNGNPSQYAQAAQAAAAPAASTPTQTANNAGLTNAQYMALRANPGRVTTPGATVPQNTSGYGASSGGISSFLQNYKPATSGPSSQFQQGFYSALKQLGY